jgi:TPP-dependent pyruvate/acetoin dehydrogenase alpha subunit
LAPASGSDLRTSFTRSNAEHCRLPGTRSHDALSTTNLGLSAIPAIHTDQPDQRTAEATLAHQCLYYMSMMRELEDRIERKLYRQGKIVGGVYVGRGQEAIPVGTALLSGPDDVMLPSHRDQAVFLIRGVSPGRILAQYMGRVGGLTRGRDGNMHMGDMKHGIVAIISALAGKTILDGSRQQRQVAIAEK